jgi:oligopeptide transport system substrate-binding protein
LKKSRFVSLVGSLTVTASMLLSACGGTDPTATPAATAPTAAPTTGAAATTAPTTAATAAATTAATAAATAASTSPGGKTLRTYLTADPDTTDPQKGSFVGEIGWVHMAYEGLLELNEKNEPVPAAADGMPQVSADGKTYTVKVKKGLKYSDGKDLTAKDFYYGWTRLLDPTIPDRNYAYIAYDIVGAQDLSEAPVTDTVKIKEAQDKVGVKMQGDDTIVFTLSSPVAYFNYILASWIGMPVREDLVKAGGDTWTQDPKNYIGNGPYVLKEWKQGSSSMWDANPNYRKGKPKIDHIQIQIIKESAQAFAAYGKGELDTIGVAPEDLDTAKKDPTLSKELVNSPGNCSFYIGFNLKKPPFDNLKVRQAFAAAFDREDYVQEVLKGAGTPATSFIPPGRPGYAADLKQADFNPENAKKLLADAGFANGAGLPPIKITYSSTARNKTRNEWIQAQIKDNLGLDVQLDPVDPKEYTKLTKKNETLPQIYVLGWCQDYPDPQDWLSLVFRSDLAITPQGWVNDKYDSLTKQADVEQDQAKRASMYNDAQKILLEESPVVFLYWDVTNTLIKPYVTGMKEHITPSDEIIPGFKNIENMDITK